MPHLVTEEAEPSPELRGTKQNEVALSGANAVLDPQPPRKQANGTANTEQAAKMAAADLFSGIWVIQDDPEEGSSDSEASSEVNYIFRDVQSGNSILNHWT